jgi:two-component system response regulator HydG
MTPFEFVALNAQYELIKETLKATNNNMSRTAELLKIDRKTLYNKLKQYSRATEASASS